MTVDRSVTDSTLQVYFATESHPGFSHERHALLRAGADGFHHTYTVYFGSSAQWKGTLTGLRLHPAGPGKSGSVRIDRIRLLGSDTTVFSGLVSLRAASAVTETSR
jgi:hypothetical protein